MSVSFLLTTLLVSTFVVNGIVGLWAVKSPLHWFVRTAVVLGILSPLLLARAFEPFVTLLLQSTTIAAAVSLGRCLRESSLSDGTCRNNRWWNNVIRWTRPARFSLAAVLLTIGLVATLLAVGIRIPELNGNAWLSLTLIGVCSGLCVSVAQFGGLEGSRWRTIPLILLCGLLLAIPLAWLDWLVPSLVGWAGWPPESIKFGGFMGIGDEERPLVLWFVVCLCVTVVMYIWRVLMLRSKSSGNAFLVAIIVSMSILPTYVLRVFLQPVAIVPFEFPSPNAYGRIVKLGSDITKSKLNGIDVDWDTVPEAQLSAAILNIREELDALHEALKLPSRVPTNYESDELSMETLMNFRTTARALAAEGRFAITAENHDNACYSFTDAIRLGVSCRDGGLLIDGLVGIACSSEGARQLYIHRDLFSQEACKEAASAVVSLSQSVEPYEDFKTRDRAWTRATMGWHGRLQQFLFESTGSSLVFSEDNLRDQFLVEQATMRLLAMELALRSFYLEHKEWPETAFDLVPTHLPGVPRDPFDETNGYMRYVRSKNGYELYSLGANRTDDGGKHMVGDDTFLTGASKSGDLRLKDCFADDDASTQTVDETTNDLEPGTAFP